MISQKYINISDVCTAYLNSRVLISNAFNNVSSNHLIIDFKGVELISRAAAHELITTLSNYENKGTEVILTNVSDEVSTIINIVKSSIETNKRSSTVLQKLTFSSPKEVEDYILAI